jgi:hypothetical protein
MRISDAPALKRMDQSYHAPFFTACVAALTAHGYLPENESEQLRIFLRERHKSQDLGSLFTDLQRQKNSSFTILQNRLGTYHFNGLLFRWTMARATENFNYSIWSVAEELLGKAELMFNQPFHLYSGGRCIQHGPFSYFLVETAGEIHGVADELNALVKELRRWSLGRQASTSFEVTLAAHLGFEIDEEVGLADWKLHEILKKIWLRLELLVEFNTHILGQLQLNLKMTTEEPRLRFLLEDFQSLLVSTRSIGYLDLDDLDILEGKRLRMLGAMDDCKDLGFAFYQLLSSTLKTSRMPSSPARIWSETDGRAIINHLLDRGISIQDGQKALIDLQAYCETHSVSLDELLEAELHRIHPSLDSVTSQFLKKVGGGGRLSEAFHDEKQHIVLKKDTLLHHINQRLLGITLLASMILSFNLSCGVKTAPRSDVLDARPGVPYHAEQRNFPKKNAGEDKSKNKAGDKDTTVESLKAQ